MQLEIKDLYKRYDTSKDYALKGISLSIEKGEFISVLGLSGSGKSTLIRCINRLIEPTLGNIFFNGEDILEFNKGKLKKYRQRVGMIFQNYNLIDRLDVITNVLVGRFGYKSFIEILGKKFDEKEIEMAKIALKTVELEKYMSVKVRDLSGGQQQRVGIARALVQEPDIILGDEPVSSLDPITSVFVMELLKKINKEKNITMIINLHSIELAKRFSTRIIGINKGKIVFDGPPNQLDEERIKCIYLKEA
ncbi:hypothetical protein TR13x_05995 [Caloranaerobacter sp. TR13]|uniref:phosphonate ABC transporter ATP-binding protein n=1 Tax=Caloranaerobacter sp. TR13 TaxID=1302151 RepID=UPI0006D45855|nr:phosphonate ABC transporter ATP-binding protein [Caloranaerobacter sp. TR13]KPU27293.1 hypothetical protein TR13x_05995 [Caloranaerobacter sp. TR13]